MELSDLYVNVITLNCWGIPFISKHRMERMNAIATYLSEGLHDIVSLQEVWDENDFFLIRSKVINVLPYSHYFYSGVLGSGVCVFSRWPIEEVFFHAWPLNGYVHMIHHGDWFGGKGLGLCKIKYNDLSINFYSAHLHAEYSTEDIYLAHRILQAFNTAEFIKMTSAGADVVILGGDLNTQPHDLAYRIICETGILMDSCVSCLPNCSGDTLESRKWGTNERAANSYTDPGEGARIPEGKRIDYVLYNSGDQYTVKVKNYSLPLPDQVPGHTFSYSDHEAVGVKFSVRKSPSPSSKDQLPDKYIKTLEESIEVCRSAFSTLQYSKRKYIMYATSLFLLLLSTVGMAERTYMDIPRLLLVAVLFYFLFMATLWNRMEWNSLFASQKAMEIIYNTLLKRVTGNTDQLASLTVESHSN